MTKLLRPCIRVGLFWSSYKKSNKVGNLNLEINFRRLNIILGNIEDGIVLGIRIMIAYNFTYIFSTTFDILEFARTIEILLNPLFIFKINVKDISLIISIALCMIPILSKELEQTKDSLKSRGYKFKLNNLDLYIKPIMISILKKTDELEKTLIVKAYKE